MLKYKHSINLCYLLTLFFAFYIILEIITHRIALADDLGKIYDARIIDQNYFDFIFGFLNTATMSARPLSGLVTGTLMYISKYNEIFYYLGLMAFPLSLYVIYNTLKNVISTQFTSCLTFLYSTSILGTSIQFSSIMLNANLATIFYVLSVHFILGKRNLFLSCIMFLASILSYEVFMPVILINIFLIKSNKKKALYGLSTLIFVFIYRNIIQDIIFDNSYHRDSISNIYDLGRDIKISIFAVKMIVRDFFLASFEALKRLPQLNWFEIMLSCITPIIFYITSRNIKNKISYSKVRRVAYVSSAAFILSFSIFFITDYIPTMFGFENRNLGAVRLFFNITFLSYVLLLTWRLSSKTFSVILSFVVFLNIISIFCVKDAWIYANKFNNAIFQKIKNKIETKKISEGIICIDYDIHNERKLNRNFFLREPTFYEAWESPELCIRNGINPNKFKIYYYERHKSPCEYNFKISLKDKD